MNLFDTLESRRLMSVSLNAATQVLTINGTDNDDVISVTVENSKLKVTDNGVIKTFDPAKVKSISVLAKAGADVVDIKSTVYKPTSIDTGTGSPQYWTQDKVFGGSGKDTIYLRSQGAQADARGGDDVVQILAPECSVKLGSGNDKVTGGYGGSYIDAGTGTDTVDWSSASFGLVMRNGSAGAYAPEAVNPLNLNEVPYLQVASTLVGFENFIGGKGNDYIVGTSERNILRGNGGNDYINSLDGNDEIYGGAGNDRLFGGFGNDAIFGDDGDDLIYTADGTSDFISGGLGTDKAKHDVFDNKVGIEGVIF